MRGFVVKHLPSTFTWACVYVMCISIADVLGTRVNNSSGQQNFMKTFHNEANTSKSFSEALILASTNPQYDKRLFIDLPVQYIHENYKLRTCCVHKLF